MSHPGGYHREVAFNDTPEYDKSNPSDETYGKAFTSFMVWVPDFKINQVYGNTANSFNHYLILDTSDMLQYVMVNLLGKSCHEVQHLPQDFSMSGTF